jgi:hypothetical protein
MRRIFVVILGLLVLLSAYPATAQVQSRPTDPPLVTAVNESWYVNGDPIQYAGDLYYRAGATVFFNGNTMVRSGHYNGVPLYANTTVEPYSVVLVPIGRGLMQPYEKPRRGDLAGTTASRMPSFPVGSIPQDPAVLEAPGPPTGLPTASPGSINVFTPEAGAVGTTGIVNPPPPVNQPPLAGVAARQQAGRTATPQSGGTPGAVGTAGYVPPQQSSPVVSLRRPDSNVGVWVRFGGERWVSDGVAIPFVASDFVRVGDYAGYPVYARSGLKEEKIYLPSRAGLVAPYKLKD